MEVSCILSLRSEVASLRTLAMTRTVQILLETSRHTPTRTKMQEKVVGRATKRVQGLEIPFMLITEMKSMLLPIAKEMLKFYENYKDDVPVILTPHGTADIEKSVKALLKYRDNWPVRRQYEMACDHCLEEEIFSSGMKLTVCQRRNYDNEYHLFDDDEDDALSVFWFGVYEGRFDVLLSRENLSAKQCAMGFAQAVYQQNSLAAMYFLPKTAEEAILNTAFKYEHDTVFSTFLFPLRFYVSIMRADKEKFFKRSLCKQMLAVLLRWPYQNIFLMAAESVVDKMLADDFWCIAKQIASYWECNFLDCQYRSLFASFWKMGACHINNRDKSPVNVHWLLYNVFQMGDQSIILLVLNDIPEEIKDDHLFNFDERCVVTHLIYDAKYEALKCLVSVCQKTDEKLFSKFQRIFAIHAELATLKRHTYAQYFNNFVWKIRLYKFLNSIKKFRP